jgi:hypothetical protein
VAFPEPRRGYGQTGEGTSRLASQATHTTPTLARAARAHVDGARSSLARRARASALLSALPLLAACCGSAGAALSGSGGVSAHAAGGTPTTPVWLTASLRSAFASSADCPGAFGSFATGAWPPACWRPYGESSPFNRLIGANPRVSAESGAITSYMRASGWAFESDGSGNFTIDSDGSRPVYWPRSSDPMVRVRCRRHHHCSYRLRIPAGAQPQQATDGHMTVVDQAGGVEYDFWQATVPSRGKMKTTRASAIPIGANAGTGLGGQAEAAGLGLLGGLMRGAELSAGRIDHALAMSVGCVQSADVWPSPASGHGDRVCAKNGAGPHLGSLIQLNMSEAEITATKAPAWQQAVMQAMALYGIYVVDTNGPGNGELSLIKEDDLSFTSFGYPGQMSSFTHSVSGGNSVSGVPIDPTKLRVIEPCVPQGTC